MDRLHFKILAWTAAALFTAAMALQFTGPWPTNPRGDRVAALESVASVPPEVQRILTRSCLDCHSNDTVWPWYAHIAPVSWFTVGHVNRGRTELNFSEWGHYSARRRETRLHAICGLSREGEMPLPSYAMIHRSAKLTAEDVARLCAWTNEMSVAESQSSAVPSFGSRASREAEGRRAFLPAVEGSSR